MAAIGDLTMGNNEHAIIVELNVLLPTLTRRSEHLLDRTHPEYPSSRQHIDAGVLRLEQLVTRLKALRPA